MPGSAEAAALAPMGLLPSAGCALVLPPLMFAVKNGPGQKAAGRLRGWQGGPCLQLLAWLWLREEDAYSSCPRSPGVAGLVSGACWSARITTSAVKQW